jgi:hypothetical protein
MFKYFNPNPTKNKRASDCAIRALSKALDISWDDAFDILADNAKIMGDTMDSKIVMTATLREFGFYKENIPHTCPDCLTVNEFCKMFPRGIYILGTQSHIVTAIDSNFYDIWNSGDEIVDCYWTR